MSWLDRLESLLLVLVPVAVVLDIWTRHWWALGVLLLTTTVGVLVGRYS
jgi:hypothetical protein